MSDEIQIWHEETKLVEIKDLFCKNLTQTEFKIFVEMGKALKLNPFLREVWAVKFGNSPAQIFIGRDGYRKNAQRNPEYEYHNVDAVYENDSFEIVNGQVVHKYNLKDRGRLRGAYCVVKRKHASKEMFNYVEMSEYNTNQSVWKTKPATMIKKVSEAQGLRGAFQEMFEGTYDEVEDWRMDKSDAIDIKSDVTSNTEKLKEILKEPIKIPPITELQLSEISSLIMDLNMTEVNLDKALAYFKVKAVSDLNQEQASKWISSLISRLPKETNEQG